MVKTRKMFSIFVIILVLTVALVGCKNDNVENESTTVIAYNEAMTAHYDVVLREEEVKIDGELDDEIWKNIPMISGGFHFPWDDKEAPLTKFKAYNDGVNFYFGFDVLDSDILIEEEWKEDESTVDNEDRVELFFAGGSIDKPTVDGIPLYYGIEIDPLGRVHDYSIKYYREFDSEWNLEGLETKAKETDVGYSVEGKVPIKTLESLKLINNNNVMRVGIYRAEFSKPSEDGQEPVMEWISWIDPKTEEPDFHVDSSFGEFRFLK